MRTQECLNTFTLFSFFPVYHFKRKVVPYAKIYFSNIRLSKECLLEIRSSFAINKHHILSI